MITGVLYVCRCDNNTQVNLSVDKDVLDVPRKICRKCQVEMRYRLVDTEPEVANAKSAEEIKG